MGKHTNNLKEIDMNRSDIINKYITKYNYKSYLEIGVQRKAQNFNNIVCERKVSVDPAPEDDVDFRITSDAFFAQNKETFDIIFIDGLHHDYQVFIDIENALKCLKENGTIVCHDMLPNQENEQWKHPGPGGWTGDCWKAWMKCRSLYENKEMFVINTDWGVGIIRDGKQELIKIPDVLDWNFYVTNRILMNSISEQEFLERL